MSWRAKAGCGLVPANPPTLKRVWAATSGDQVRWAAGHGWCSSDCLELGGQAGAAQPLMDADGCFCNAHKAAHRLAMPAMSTSLSSTGRRGGDCGSWGRGSGD